MTAKGEFKAFLQTLKDAKNQNAYLEALLAFEERSGFSTLVSDLDEIAPLYMSWSSEALGLAYMIKKLRQIMSSRASQETR